MFNVLDRLRSLRTEEPQKFQRICSRLLQLQRTNQDQDMPDESARRDHIERVAEVRKATDDFFSRLATIDRASEHFWKAIGNRWQGQTEESDLPQPDDPHGSKRKHKKHKPEEQLIKTILLSPHPHDTLRLILQHNHPQRILKKLLLNRNKRSVLYGIRMKYGLPLPAYLIPKQEFTRTSLHESRSEESRARTERAPVRKSRRTSSADGRRRSSVVEELLTLAREPQNTSFSIQKLASGSFIHSKDRKRRKSSRVRRRSRFGSAVANRDVSGEDESSENDFPNTSEPDGGFLPAVSESINEDEKNEHIRPDNASNLKNVTFSNEDHSAEGRASPTAILEDSSGGMDQYRLQRLKIIFEESDTDDEPGLDINEFKQAMKKIIGESVPEREIELIFMKVDANCDGNVDWNEFLEYTLREFQERDLMTQLTRDSFFEKHPTVVPHSRNQREIRAVAYASPHGTSKAGRDLGNGRYFSMNREGEVICWSTEFKKIATHELIPDIRGHNVYIRANDMCIMPEIKTLVVSFTTGDVQFYAYDDSKLDLCFRISNVKSPVLCLHYYYQEYDSLLLLGDQSGNVSVIRFRNIMYDGLWGSLQLRHSHDPRVTWDFLVKKGKAYYIKGQFGSDWISQVRFFPGLNAVVACSEDPRYSMAVIPFGKQREPTYFSQKYGFNCFDYSDFLNVIATGSKNRSVQVWNPDNPITATMHFDGHEAGVDKIVVCRDADFLVVISLDSNQTVKVWDFKDQSCLQTYDAKDLTIAHYIGTFLVYNPVLDHLVYGARDILMLKRVDPHREGPIDRFQKTHDEPIVAALYNDLFECIVTACQESTIMVWNFLTGDKIIQFRNAHTVVHNGKVVQVPIKSMCFDANQRRLLSCGLDGIIKIWNFNNGACLSSFDHLAGTDLNVVRYQKNKDLVMATGWNQYIFMVRDTRGEDEVDETVYEWEKVHRSDITALEIIYTSDDVSLKFTKSTKSEDFLEPEIRPDSQSSYIPSRIKRTSFEDLRESNDEQRNPSVHSAEGNTASLDSNMAAEKDSGNDTQGNEESEKDSGSESGNSETSSATERRKMSDDGSYAVTGCSDGEIIVWHLFSGQPICCLNTDGSPLALSRMARNIYAGQLVNDFPKVELKDSGSLETFLNLQTTQHATPLRKNFTSNPDDPIIVPKVTLQSRNTITNILVLDQRAINDGNCACLVTASTDGFIRAWSIHHTNGGLKALFFAGHRIGSFVETMCTDANNELLFTGDTSGYVKIWLLCDWAQSEEHLLEHRHHFDPRNFPFIKRHKFFSPIIAFRANHMMQQTVSTLPSAQRGFYRQPYLLNSYQAHLLRITQIQIVPPKTVIITGSADCSVRLWQYSGLYIGTLGQPLDFEHETSQSSQMLPEVVSQGNVNFDDGDFLNEDEDPDEIVLKPKVVVPVDLATRGSAVTLNVLHSTQHKRTIVPESQLNKIDESDIADEALHGRSEYITALGELNVKKQRFDEESSPPTDFSSLAKASEEADEDLMFAHVPLKHIVHVGTLQDVVPEKLYQFNLGKIQAELLDKLPADLKQPFVSLFKAGKLTGSALNDLIHLVSTRENGLKLPRVTNHMRFRREKKVRMHEEKRSQSAQGQRDKRQPDMKQGAESPATVSELKKTHPRSGRSSSLGTQGKMKSHQDTTPKERFQRSTEVSPSQASRGPVHKQAKSKNKWHKVMPTVRAVVKAKSVVSYESSDESVDALKGRPSELNRIQLNKLNPSEQEFIDQLANHQRRNAKFEYLDLLEKNGSDAEQATPYLPVIKNDPEFYREISPHSFARVLVTVAGKKKTIIKRNRSVASVDRIQRVYKLPDFGPTKNYKRKGILGLVVPPEPRRLPSIIKGQINSSGKRSITEIDLIAHEEDVTIKNQNIWGDQESLPIFQSKFSSLSVHGKRKSAQHSTRTAMLKEAGERLGYHMDKSTATKSKVHRATAAIVSELRRKQDGGKQRPFSNRYLYRQLSDSVLIPHDPFVKEKDCSPPRTLEDYLRYDQLRNAEQTESNAGIAMTQKARENQ